MKQTLTLVRKSDNDAIYRAAAADASKVTLDKVSWFMPHVLPADAEKLQLYKTIESKASLPVAYRMRQCDSIQSHSQQVLRGDFLSNPLPKNPVMSL